VTSVVCLLLRSNCLETTYRALRSRSKFIGHRVLLQIRKKGTELMVSLLQCLAHSWYLMADMQLYVISPLILVFLLAWKRRKVFATVGVLMSVGVTCSFLVNYLLDLPTDLVSGK
jgi:peptidoglycan/LPS O-acetylase OafA/YrhL